MTDGRDNGWTNGWTGGQYSLFRLLLGAYLFVHFAYLTPWSAEVFSSSGMLPQAQLSPLSRVFPSILLLTDHPVAVTLLCLSGAAAAAFLALGRFDRAAALWCWYVLACLFARNPLIQNPSLPYVGWMLLLHAALPRAPYGSLEARGRADPAGNWIMPPALFAAAWIVLAISYSYSGYTKLFSPSWVAGDTVAAVLRNPLARDWFLRDFFLSLPDITLRLVTWFILVIELLFAPIVLWRRARPWMWAGMLLVQFGFAALLRFPDLTFAMLLFHMLTFDPAWIKRQPLDGVIVLYDGACALCHASVRFLLAEDQSGALRFAPLDSATADRLVPTRSDGPVSMLVHLPDGSVLAEDRAVLHLLTHLGGYWRLIGQVGNWLPQRLTRWAYRTIGDNRYRLFGRKSQACPMLPPSLRARVLA